MLEYERGNPFKTWWPEHAHIGEKELLTLVQPLPDGLSVVHGMGFLHRDIKPDNIQVRRRDGSLVLLDFGSARQAVSTGTQDDVAVTPGYAPPSSTKMATRGLDRHLRHGRHPVLDGAGHKPPDAMDRAMAAGRPGGADSLVPATVAAQGRYSASFLKAIDWTLGLQEALRAGDAADPADPSDHVPHHHLALRSAPRRLAFGLWCTARRVVHPGSWPMAIKMSLAMVMAGVVIYHPDQRVLYRSLTRLPEATLAKIRADQRFKRDSIESLDMSDLAQAVVQAKEQGHVTYRSAISRTEEIAGFSPVAGQDWVVGVGEPRSAFEEPLNRLFAQLLWSVLLVGLLFTGLALMFARSIVRPIKALTGAADALKRGDYAAANLQVRTRDEIGQLARTFNVLIDVLRQRERERDRDRDRDRSSN